MDHTTQATTRTQHRRQTTDQRQTAAQKAAQKLHDTETLRNELDTALRSRGIVLPSLRVDPLAYGDTDPEPLIDLGRCTTDMARTMIDVFRKTRP